MKCEFYMQKSACSFASRVYGAPSPKLSDDELDYISEFCTLAEGSNCRDKNQLVKKLNLQTS